VPGGGEPGRWNRAAVGIDQVESSGFVPPFDSSPAGVLVR